MNTPLTDKEREEMAAMLIGEADHPMTDEEKAAEENAKEFAAELQKFAKEQPSIKALEDAENSANNRWPYAIVEGGSNADPKNPSDFREKKVTVDINTITGARTIVEDDELDKAADIDINELMDMSVYEKGNISLDHVDKASIKAQYNLNDKECDQYLECIAKYQKGEDFNVMEALPGKMKDLVKNLSGKEGVDVSRFAEVAKTIMGSTLNDISMDQFVIDIDKVLEKEISKSSQELIGVYFDLILSKVPNLTATADKIREEAPDKADMLMNIAGCIQDSYEWKDFIDALENKKIKIKRFDLEDPEKVYREFLFKYEKNQLGINNVRDMRFFLNKHLCLYNGSIDFDFSEKTIDAFVIAFCKFCRNMRPDYNIGEHVFMYYFVKNVIMIATHVEKPEHVEFVNNICNNSIKCLKILSEKYGIV